MTHDPPPRETGSLVVGIVATSLLLAWSVSHVLPVVVRQRLSPAIVMTCVGVAVVSGGVLVAAVKLGERVGVRDEATRRRIERWGLALQCGAVVAIWAGYFLSR